MLAGWLAKVGLMLAWLAKVGSAGQIQPPMLCAKAGAALGGDRFWTRYSGHCFSHLNMNVDTRAKIGHICLNMRRKVKAQVLLMG
jgi:hypothetical protein